MRIRRWWKRLWWEARLSWAWPWLIPVALVAVVLTVMVASGTPATERPTVLREALEIGLPLTSLFLAVPLLESEWARGTFVLLAARASVLRILLLRLALAGGFLAVITFGGALGSLVISREGWRAAQGMDAQWLMGTLLTALAPTAVLVALALFVAHAAVDAISGYLVGAAFWLINLIAEVTLPSDVGLRPMLLFGWTFQQPGGLNSWVAGKVLLLVIAAGLLALQGVLLRSEARFVRATGE